jgi:hypothetical protein
MKRLLPVLLAAAAWGQPQVRFAGVRSSDYGIKPFPTPEAWSGAMQTMAGYFPGSAPLAIWIVGALNGRARGVTLEFPHPDNDTGYGPNFVFSEEDKHEAYLKYFDEHGIQVLLQVEPGFADVPTVIDLVLDRYGRHPSVMGFGIDIEWFRNLKTDAPNGLASDALVKEWEARVKRHNPAYRLFVKHFRIEDLPQTYRGDVIFVDDSQQLPNFEAFLAEYKTFADFFYPNLVMFQIGYQSDRKWWARLPAPAPQRFGERLAAQTRQPCGIIWVDFTLRGVLMQ